MGSPQQLHDAQGRTILLGRKLGEGAQGAVFEVQGAPQLAAKVYKDRHLPNRDEVYKITGMTQGCDPALTSIAAWPITTLHKSPSGSICGFTMPKMSGYRPVHVLYSPANRKFSFPKADWAFLIHTARNVSSAVATIHSHGHVIGDINQNNVLVGDNATAKFIDCDSFQMCVNGRNFLCEVGVPEFTSPELHGKSFAGLTRTTNHDAFGLAVMIFHLLFMGRHPFAGRFLGKGDKPIDAAIKEFRFAFGQAAAARQMALPPHSLRLLQTSAELASLFERAFSESAARGEMRPTAQEWMNALDKFRGNLVTCNAVAAHKFHRTLTNCPWCEIQRNAGPDFFISVTIGANIRTASSFDLTSVWSAITAMSPPDISPVIVPPISTSSNPIAFPPYLGFTKQQAFWLRGGTLAVAAATIAGLPLAVSLVLTCALLFLRYFVAPNARERRKRHAEVSALAKAVRAKQEEWSRVGNDFNLQFSTKLKALEDCKNRYESIVNSRRQELDRVEQAREKEQRKEFLERHFIKNYRIDGIGQGRRATLLSYGIETLYDVTPSAVSHVPGFGPMLTNTLLTLRQRVDAQFRFDSKKGVNPAAVVAIEQKYALLRVPLEKALLGGPQEIAPMQKASQQQRATFTDSTTELTKALAQARISSTVTEHDPWQAIIGIALIFGFAFRFAVGGMLGSLQPAKQAINTLVPALQVDASRLNANRVESSALRDSASRQSRSSETAPPVQKSEQTKEPVGERKKVPERQAKPTQLTESVKKMKEHRAASATTLILHESELRRIREEYERVQDLYSKGEMTEIELTQLSQILAEASLRVNDDKHLLREIDEAIREIDR